MNSLGTEHRAGTPELLIMGAVDDVGQALLSVQEPMVQETRLQPQVLNKLMWRILPPVWLGYVLNIIDRQNLGYAQLQMARDLHLSASAFGFASGIFFAAYSLMQVG